MEYGSIGIWDWWSTTYKLEFRWDVDLSVVGFVAKVRKFGWYMNHFHNGYVLRIWILFGFQLVRPNIELLVCINLILYCYQCELKLFSDLLPFHKLYGAVWEVISAVHSCYWITYMRIAMKPLTCQISLQLPVLCWIVVRGIQAFRYDAI